MYKEERGERDVVGLV